MLNLFSRKKRGNTFATVIWFAFGGFVMLATQQSALAEDYLQCQTDDQCIIIFPSAPCLEIFAVNKMYSDKVNEEQKELKGVACQSMATYRADSTAKCIKNQCKVGAPDKDGVWKPKD